MTMSRARHSHYAGSDAKYVGTLCSRAARAENVRYRGGPDPGTLLADMAIPRPVLPSMPAPAWPSSTLQPPSRQNR